VQESNNDWMAAAAVKAYAEEFEAKQWHAVDDFAAVICARLSGPPSSSLRKPRLELPRVPRGRQSLRPLLDTKINGREKCDLSLSMILAMIGLRHGPLSETWRHFGPFT
jgi:hypothetical protein